LFCYVVEQGQNKKAEKQSTDFIGIRRMASSGMLCRVALETTEASEELSAPFIRVTRIDELGTTLAVISNRRTVSSHRASFASYS
jgi:hypothetical protein